MKITLIIAFLGIYISSFGQSIIYVDSKQDKRYIAYRDSMLKYNQEIRIRKAQIKLLDEAPDLYAYDRISDSLGYRDTDLPKTDNNQHLYATIEKKVVDVRTSLLTCFHSLIGDITCIYRTVVPKPSIIVIHKLEKPIKIVEKPQNIAKVIKIDTIPTKRVNILYTSNGKLDSIITLRVDTSFSFN